MVKIFPAFMHGYEIESGKMSPVKASPDGNYIIYINPTTSAFGNLMLYDFENNKEWLVCKDIELDLYSPPIEWSSDSKYFVYSKEYKIYYYSIEQITEIIESNPYDFDENLFLDALEDTIPEEADENLYTEEIINFLLEENIDYETIINEL